MKDDIRDKKYLKRKKEDKTWQLQYFLQKVMKKLKH